ncbi:hypothetical protein ACSBR2_026057 [Camellia fascicularis]
MGSLLYLWDMIWDKGLVSGGRTFQNSYSIRKTCDFLLSKQVDSGGWEESYLSCQNKVMLPHI